MNRRQLLSLLGVSPAILAASPAEARGKKHKNDFDNGGDAAKFLALSPKGTPPPVQRFSMAPRLNTIQGKTIYLVDTGFLGADQLLQQIQLWFQKNQPDVKTVLRKKAGTYPEERSQALGGDQGQRQRDHHGHRPLKRLHSSDRRSLRNDGKDGNPERAAHHARLRGSREVDCRAARHAHAANRLHRSSDLGQNTR